MVPDPDHNVTAGDAETDARLRQNLADALAAMEAKEERELEGMIDDSESTSA